MNQVRTGVIEHGSIRPDEPLAAADGSRVAFTMRTVREPERRERPIPNLWIKDDEGRWIRVTAGQLKRLSASQKRAAKRLLASAARMRRQLAGPVHFTREQLHARD
jgi:hypothetical protein